MKLKPKKNKRLPEIKKLTSTYMYTDLYVNMPTRGLLSFHTKDCPVSVVAKVMFTYKCDLLLLNASKKYRSKKERLAQNVVHVGKEAGHWNILPLSMFALFCSPHFEF